MGQHLSIEQHVFDLIMTDDLVDSYLKHKAKEYAIDCDDHQEMTAFRLVTITKILTKVKQMREEIEEQNAE